METSSIKILKPGDESALEAFLLPRVETSMFLIGNLRASGPVDNGQPYQGTYAARFQADAIVAVVAHYWNRNLVLQAPIDLAALCAQAVGESGRPVQGLIGPANQVGVMKGVLGIDDPAIQMDETEKLYSLDLDDLALPGNLASGEVKGRRIESGDLDLLARWNVDFTIQALGDQDSPRLRRECREAVERAWREKRSWVLEKECRPVACSSFNTAIKEAVQIGGVWTPPELRCRGYGRAVVAASLLDARSEGASKGILFTGEGNIAAQKAYEALGFRCIGDYRLLLLRVPLEHLA